MVTYDARTCLLVVDVQNDFADPAGSLSIRGGVDIIPALNAEVRRALDAGASVIYTQDWHPASTPHFITGGGTWPVHCVGGTWGADFHPDLLVAGPSVRKGVAGEDGYSGFSMRDPDSDKAHPTALEAMLRERDVERVVVGGLATDYCVKATILDAVRLGFGATVLTDAIAAVEVAPGDGAKAEAEMAAAGAVLSTVDGGG